jgi:AraC family transcriptional regulator
MSAVQIPGLRVVKGCSWACASAQVFTREGGEAVWQHPQHRLVLPLTGAATRDVTAQTEAGATRQFKWEDGVGFFPANSTTRIATDSSTTLQVLIDPEIFRSVEADLRGVRTGSLEPQLPLHDPTIAQIARTMMVEIDSGLADNLLVEFLSRALALRLLRGVTRLPTGDSRAYSLSGERLRRVVDYIAAHLGDSLTLSELANVACLSPYHFSRAFRQATGSGVQRYVIQRRIEYAKGLLRRTNLPLAEIAYASGFNSQASFTTCFGQRVGQPPARFRRQEL